MNKILLYTLLSLNICLFAGCGPSETPEEAEIRIAKKCDLLAKKAQERQDSLRKQLEADLAAEKIVGPQMDFKILQYKLENPSERSVIFLKLSELEKKNFSQKLRYELEKEGTLLLEQRISNLKQLSDILPVKIAEAKKERQDRKNSAVARVLLKKFSPITDEFVNRRYPLFIQAMKSTGTKGLFNQVDVFNELSSLVTAKNLMRYAQHEKDFSTLPKDLQERIIIVASTTGKEKDLETLPRESFNEMFLQSNKKYPRAWNIISIMIKDSDLHDEFEFVRNRQNAIDSLSKEKGITRAEAEKHISAADSLQIKSLLFRYSVAANAAIMKYVKEISDIINSEYPSPEYNNLDRKGEFNNLINLLRRTYIDDLTLGSNEIKKFSGKIYVDVRKDFFNDIHVFEDKKVFLVFDGLPTHIKKLDIDKTLDLIKKNWLLAEETAKQQNILVEKAFLKLFQ